MRSLDIKVHPSTMLIKARYAAALLLAGLVLYYSVSLNRKAWMAALVVPAAITVSAVTRHLKTRFTTMEMIGDRLQMETGMTSKTSRSVPLAKVQDITVSQSFGQRLLGVGDITVVTAGEAGSLTIQDVSAPRQVAERILDRVGSQAK